MTPDREFTAVGDKNEYCFVIQCSTGTVCQFWTLRHQEQFRTPFDGAKFFANYLADCAESYYKAFHSMKCTAAREDWLGEAIGLLYRITNNSNVQPEEFYSAPIGNLVVKADRFRTAIKDAMEFLQRTGACNDY